MYKLINSLVSILFYNKRLCDYNVYKIMDVTLFTKLKKSRTKIDLVEALCEFRR